MKASKFWKAFTNVFFPEVKHGKAARAPLNRKEKRRRASLARKAINARRNK
jgi:hypothetical protein